MRHRVFTYITRDQELLIFDHVDQRYLDPQIPGGTVEPAEQPQAAALREAHEETGLVSLEIISFLGDFETDLAPLGRQEQIHAWFYHLETRDKTPSLWRHFEQHRSKKPRSSDKNEPIEFELYWVPIREVPKLGGLDNTMLYKVREAIIE